MATEDGVHAREIMQKEASRWYPIATDYVNTRWLRAGCIDPTFKTVSQLYKGLNEYDQQLKK